MAEAIALEELDAVLDRADALIRTDYTVAMVGMILSELGVPAGAPARRARAAGPVGDGRAGAARREW